MKPVRLAQAILVALAAASAAGCGGSTTPTKEAESAPTAAATTGAAAPKAAGSAEAAAEPETKGIPDKCTQKGQVCAPPPGFVKRLCGGYNPDVALLFFRKGSPFTRGYLRGNTDAWNASGGASSGDKLVFDEEVIVLLERGGDLGGMQVSGASGTFDVLRWDGSCASLSSGELTFTPPPKPKNAKIAFKDLGDHTQEVLLKDEKIAKLNADRRKECKGVSMGEVSAKCVKLVEQLSDSVAEYVRAGRDVPEPTKIP
jgi:hypothetical protein